MPAIEPSQKTVVAETKSAERQGSPQFIPKLKGKKVIIRLVSGGQPDGVGEFLSEDAGD